MKQNKSNNLLIFVSVCLLIGLVLYGIFKFDEEKIQFHTLGFLNKASQVEVSYDGIYTCSIVDERDNYLHGQEITIRCQSKFLPINTYYSNKTIQGLAYPSDESISNLLNQFEKDGINNIIALYMKKGEKGMSYFALSKNKEEFIGYLEENMYTKFGYTYYQMVDGKVAENIRIDEYKIEDIDELKKQLDNNKFELVE